MASQDGYLELGEKPSQRITNKSLAGAVGLSILLCIASFVAGRYFVNGHADSTAAPNTNQTQKLWSSRMLPVYQEEPLCKNVIRQFDLYLMNGATFDSGDFKARNVGQWLAEDFKYDTVGFPGSDSLKGWCLGGEEKQYRTAFPTSGFTQMLFFGTDIHATTTSYGCAHWVEDLFGVPAPKEWTYFRVTDFYHLRKSGENTGLIDYNFMMMDFADLFRRTGRPVLPPASLPEGLVLPPAANDGVPAPFSVMVAGRDSVTAEAAAAGALADVWAGEELPEKWWHSDMTFYGPGGIGMARGTEQYLQHVIQPFRAAFRDRVWEKNMLFCEGNYCGAYGNLTGVHVGSWVGQAATHTTKFIRFAMHFRIVDGKIKEGWAIFDFPGFFTQLGLDFFKIAREYTTQRNNSL